MTLLAYRQPVARLLDTEVGMKKELTDAWGNSDSVGEIFLSKILYWFLFRRWFTLVRFETEFCNKLDFCLLLYTGESQIVVFFLELRIFNTSDY